MTDFSVNALMKHDGNKHFGAFAPYKNDCNWPPVEDPLQRTEHCLLPHTTSLKPYLSQQKDWSIRPSLDHCLGIRSDRPFHHYVSHRPHLDTHYMLSNDHVQQFLGCNEDVNEQMVLRGNPYSCCSTRPIEWSHRYDKPYDRSMMIPMFSRERRRARTTFTSRQLDVLEENFQEHQYIVGEKRKSIARLLHLNEVQIKVWFQNRRTKYRQDKELERLGQLKSKKKGDHHLKKWQSETAAAQIN